MEEDEWISVSRRENRTSVFQRLGDRCNRKDVQYNRKDVDKFNSMSQAIYITNFPNQTNNGDLWRLCEKYGNVVDVFITNKKSRLGKNVGFVRFIKVFFLEGLVRDLCSIWIGNHKLFASIPRFSRKNNDSVYKTGARPVDIHSKPRYVGNVVNDMLKA